MRRRRRDGSVRRRRARAARRAPRDRLPAHPPRRAARPRPPARRRRRRRRRPSGSGSRCTSRSGPSCRTSRVDAVVVCAYGLLIPADLLARALWLNVHPSLLPRWRGAAPVERAILAGDERDRRHDPRDGEGARRRARSPPRRRSRSGPTTTPARSSPAPAERRRRAARRACCPSPSFTPQPDEGATYAEKIGAADRELDLGDPVDAWRRVRALSPHIGAWAMLARPPGDGLARAARRRRVRPASRCSRRAGAG